MNTSKVSTIWLVTASLVVLGGVALGKEQDRYTLKVPGGLAFSEFRGYEGWSVISISENEGK